MLWTFLSQEFIELSLPNLDSQKCSLGGPQNSRQISRSRSVSMFAQHWWNSEGKMHATSGSGLLVSPRDPLRVFWNVQLLEIKIGSTLSPQRRSKSLRLLHLHLRNSNANQKLMTTIVLEVKGFF